jgi:hypothetical protein
VTGSEAQDNQPRLLNADRLGLLGNFEEVHRRRDWWVLGSSLTANVCPDIAQGHCNSHDDA